MGDDLWDRLIAGSRVCPALLQRWCQEAPAGPVARGRQCPHAGTSQAAGEDDRWGRWPALNPPGCLLSSFTEVVLLPKVQLLPQESSCTSASSNGLKSTAIPLGARCPAWEGTSSKALDKGQHCISSQSILAAPLQALTQPQLCTASCSWASVRTVALVTWATHTLPSPAHSQRNPAAETEALAALDQSTHLKGVVTERKTWEETEKTDLAFVTLGPELWLMLFKGV